MKKYGYAVFTLSLLSLHLPHFISVFQFTKVYSSANTAWKQNCSVSIFFFFHAIRSFTLTGVCQNLAGWIEKLECGGDIEKQNFFKKRFLKRLHSSPVATDTDTANEQHYEVPTDFFTTVRVLLYFCHQINFLMHWLCFSHPFLVRFF